MMHSDGVTGGCIPICIHEKHFTIMIDNSHESMACFLGSVHSSKVLLLSSFENHKHINPRCHHFNVSCCMKQSI